MLILISKENMKYNKYKILVYISGFIIIILSEGVLGYVAEDIEINLLLFFLPILITLFIYFIFFYKLKLKYRALKT